MNIQIDLNKEVKVGIDPVGRYCKHCQDRYYNYADIDSIRRYKACVFCLREGKAKKEE